MLQALIRATETKVLCWSLTIVQVILCINYNLSCKAHLLGVFGWCNQITKCKDRLRKLRISRIMGHITSQLLVPNIRPNVRTNSHEWCCSLWPFLCAYVHHMHNQAWRAHKKSSENCRAQVCSNDVIKEYLKKQWVSLSVKQSYVQQLQF